MNIIKNNPYRVIGLLVGATAREQQRQVKRLSQFIEAEQDLQDDYSFPGLGQLRRSLEDVSNAASRLNLDSDKMDAALFWFYKGNDITDEAAIDSLKESDTENSIGIWTKLTASGQVTQRNSSAFQNLSTLFLCQAFNDSAIDIGTLEKAVLLKLKFLESDYCKDFKALATDETYKTTKKELQLAFLKRLQSEIDEYGGVSFPRFLEILSKEDFIAKGDFLKTLVEKPVGEIEKNIDHCKRQRKANKEIAATIGRRLYEQSLESLDQLKLILGHSDIRCTSMSDKISDEILQCGIDYFSHYRDSNTDPGQNTMDLFRKARLLAIGNIAKQRCLENTENLQEWIDEKPVRDKQKLIAEDLQFVSSKLERFQSLSDTVANAKDLVDSCKPRLVNIKSALGSSDDFYLKICSAVVSHAQGMLVAAVNLAQEGFKNRQEDPLATLYLSDSRLPSPKNYVTLEGLSTTVNSAHSVVISMQNIDMTETLKQSFRKNKEALENIKRQIDSATSRTAAPAPSNGCYIATMAYGDYNHPQVLVLRQYRDSVLEKSIFGRWFIKAYYCFSPKLVKQLKDKPVVNGAIRSLLDKIVNLIQ